MDALSDILRAIRLRSSVYFKKAFFAPWGMDMPDGPFAQFHLVVRGNCLVGTPEFVEPLALCSGDVIVFPHGQRHWIADSSKSRRLPGTEILDEHLRGETPSVAKGKRTTLICGHFEFANKFDHPFLSSLPNLIHISDDERRTFTWLETATTLMMQEADLDAPGADVVVNRLAEVLFIQLLRAYFLQAGHSLGFCAALQDGLISHALKLLHSEPEDDWSLERIANKIGMSRSAFAARFKDLVGMTPMSYLANWRMCQARELLTNQQLTLAEVAERVGYLSVSAFSHAFKRKFNENPGEMKRRVSLSGEN